MRFSKSIRRGAAKTGCVCESTKPGSTTLPEQSISSTCASFDVRSSCLAISRPVGSAAKHIVQMHHEVVMRKLGVALLLKTALVELLAIGRARLRREGNLLRWFALERDGSRRRINDTYRL